MAALEARSCARTASTRLARPSATSSSSRSARTPRRSTDALLRARRDRPADGAVRRAGRAADHRGHAGGDRVPRASSSRRVFAPLRPGRAGRELGRIAPVSWLGRARGARLRMRTTLKRGVGRGAPLERERPGGVAAGAARPGHDLPPAGAAPRSGALARAHASSAGRRSSLVVLRRRRRRRRVPLRSTSRSPPSRRKSAEVKEAAKRSTSPLAGQPATALVIGYDRRADEAKGTPSRSDTLMLVRADPRREDDLAPLVPARPAGRDPLPGQGAVHGQDQRRLRLLRRAGDAPDGAQAHRRAGQLPDHRQLPRLPAARRQARRRLDGRRPPLLQRPRRPVRLRDDQPPARLPAADRATGRSTSCASGTPTRDLYRNARQQLFVRALKDQIELELLASIEAAEGDQGDHAQHRGRAGRRQGRQRQDRALVRRCSRTRCRRVTSSRRGSRGSRASPT